MDSSSIAKPTERPYVSTGHLPVPETVQKLVCDAHQRFTSNTDGQNSQVYPAFDRIPSELRPWPKGESQWMQSIVAPRCGALFVVQQLQVLA